MLLARLQGKDEGPLSVTVFRLAHDTAGQFAQILGLAGHKAHVRAAVIQRNAQGLAVAHGNVGPPFGRAFHHCQGTGVAILDQHGFLLVQGIGKTGQVLYDPITVHGRDDRTRHITRGKGFLQIGQRGLSAFGGKVSQVDPGIFRIGFHHMQHIRQQGFGKQDAILLLGTGHGHLHGFRRSGRAVVHGGVAHIQSRQGADHALILENVPERSLGDLALIGRISRQELGTGSKIRNDRGRIMVIGPRPHKDLQGHILRIQ